MIFLIFFIILSILVFFWFYVIYNIFCLRLFCFFVFLKIYFLLTNKVFCKQIISLFIKYLFENNFYQVTSLRLFNVFTDIPNIIDSTQTTPATINIIFNVPVDFGVVSSVASGVSDAP